MDHPQDLTDRIAEVLLREAVVAGEPIMGTITARHVAAAVVEELKLKWEGEEYAVPDSARHRWVTEWVDGLH